MEGKHYNIRIDVIVRNCTDSAKGMNYWKVLVIATLNLRVP
jgi:hypothetical protein